VFFQSGLFFVVQATCTFVPTCRNAGFWVYTHVICSLLIYGCCVPCGTCGGMCAAQDAKKSRLVRRDIAVQGFIWAYFSVKVPNWWIEDANDPSAR